MWLLSGVIACIDADVPVLELRALRNPRGSGFCVFACVCSRCEYTYLVALSCASVVSDPWKCYPSAFSGAQVTRQGQPSWG
jgi:hypothetical protein